MLTLEKENQHLIFNLEKLPENIDFFDKNFWLQEQRILGTAKGRGTTYFLQSKDLLGVNSVLRHYYRGGLFGKFNKDLYFLRRVEDTRSFAEFKLLKQLRQAGLNVPKPLGARVTKVGLGLYRADILIEKIEQAQDLTKVLQEEELTSTQWQKIGALIAQMHQLQICHTDLNAHNIMLQKLDGVEKFWLIDFDKCFVRTGEAWKKENLQRLLRSFRKEVGRLQIKFTEDNWQDLLQGYTGS
ncbi:3-deoxy-D-manno-octulosonic acid kinase [Psittacicella gerlachiana]|uniref:3-deoxy-D-manno-octulosonic acid kinase n=1 Tax=Psittacicella gerlachiana TaxID=2028574 RepID=A0A3A1YBQ0_9GAMM|nr:3-deoxy-D-manno-octulosonic acid kinase [Psittacicella gerlachiana]RIY35562.1 3-deoxy-D-manno-octulosonic acid kinase [Psittacicella gerlachiana]